jgi:Zn finger protein HypA/HybF involved in hydrogenase expression
MKFLNRLIFKQRERHIKCSFGLHREGIMKILEKTYQHRRDFRADMVCEHCGHIEKNVSGYDDTYFHTEVIPNMVCKKCGKKSGEVTSRPNLPDSVVL